MKLDTESLAHTKWNCKYHIVFAPKYRRQVIYGKIKSDIGQILRKLCEYKGGRNNRSRSMPRSYTHVSIYTAEIQRVTNNGISKRKKLADDI